MVGWWNKESDWTNVANTLLKISPIGQNKKRAKKQPIVESFILTLEFYPREDFWYKNYCNKYRHI